MVMYFEGEGIYEFQDRNSEKFRLSKFSKWLSFMNRIALFTVLSSLYIFFFHLEFKKILKLENPRNSNAVNREPKANLYRTA